MRMIMMGAPGAGKGTISERLATAMKIPCISTGQLLREIVAAGGELGNKVKQFTDTGKLVPDETVIDVLDKRLTENDCSGGYILDGFPRTLQQAEALSKRVEIDVVLSLEVPDDEIEKRMTGRRVCAGCGMTYHTDHNPPKQDNVCDSCGGIGLTRRADDHPDTVRARLKTHHEHTEPLKGYYAREGKLKSVSARCSIDEVFERCMQVLDKK
jgi:adenylate kinase